MAISEIYVDPVSGNDTTGDGTSTGTAWKTVQKALDSCTLGTNGSRINVRGNAAGNYGADVLTAVLDLIGGFTGTISTSQPLIFQGYTSAAGDGGIGEIEGTTNNCAIWNDVATDNVHFMDLKLSGDTGSGYVLSFDNNCSVIRCEVIADYGAIDADTDVEIAQCKITWASAGAAQGITLASTGGVVANNTLIAGANATDGIGGTAGSVIVGNIIDGVTAGAGFRYGINITSARATFIANNTIKASGSNDAGILISQAFSATIENNYVEGYSDTGKAYSITGDVGPVKLAGNKWYNCTTGVSDTTNQANVTQVSNAVTTASGLTGSYYEPTSELIEAGYPTAYPGLGAGAHDPDVGAIQKAAAASTSNPLIQKRLRQIGGSE